MLRDRSTKKIRVDILITTGSSERTLSELRCCAMCAWIRSHAGDACSGADKVDANSNPSESGFLISDQNLFVRFTELRLMRLRAAFDPINS